MIAELIALALAVLLGTAQCPIGWSLHEGVRRTGEYACYGPLEPAGCGEPVGPDIPCRKPAITRGRIYCTSGHEPIVVDYRTVGCQARH